MPRHHARSRRRGTNDHRHADGQVDGAEALALARQRARDHDQVGVVDRRRTLALHVAQQRTLDDPELVADQRTGRVRGDDPDGLQALQVDLDVLRGAACGGRLRLGAGLHCGRRRRGNLGHGLSDHRLDAARLIGEGRSNGSDGNPRGLTVIHRSRAFVVDRSGGSPLQLLDRKSVV